MLKIILISTAILLSVFGQSYSQSKIGVALPLMNNSENSEDKKLGQQMMKGINDALNEYNKAYPERKITIKTEDTKRDPSATLQIFNKFGSDSSVIAIFGPVFSSELINNSGAAKFHKIPIVTPTATANFVAEKNEYVFQLNPTYDIRGRIMAKFAMKELGMKNFAIFSEESYGKNFAESFSDEVSIGGGNIISEEYYNKDKKDLEEELDELKTKLIEKEKFIDFGNLNQSQMDKLKKINFKFSYTDSLVNERLVVSIYKLFGPNADRTLDSIGIIPLTNVDKTKSIIFGKTDAVYIPVSNSTEMGKTAAQYFSANINLPVLGTSDWNNEKALNENRMYIKELYFDSDFFLKDKSSENFTNDAEIRNYYFGYDGMKFLLDKISEGNKSRNSLNEALESATDYKANHNDITMKQRTNHHMTIMTYRNGELKKEMDFVY